MTKDSITTRGAATVGTTQINSEHSTHKKEFSKRLNPLLAPIIHCVKVPVRITSLDTYTRTNEIPATAIRALILYKKNAEGKAEVMPQYLLLNGKNNEVSLPPHIIAEVDEKKLLLSLEVTLESGRPSHDDSMWEVKNNITTLEITINGEYFVKIIPIDSSYVVQHITEPVRAERVCESKNDEKDIASIAVSLCGGRWMGTLNDIIGKKINVRKVNFKFKNKTYNIMMMSNSNKHYLFVKGNNLENLTDLAPEFLALDISKKYVIRIGSDEYYGARVIEKGVNALCNKLYSTQAK